MIARATKSLRPYFNTPLNAALSLVFLLGVSATLPGLLNWTILEAAFFPAVPATCKAATGACWSFVIAKSSQILFGIYPSDERWRPALVCAILLLTLLGFPIAILRALGRRSELPVVASVCTLWIELIRGLPLLSLLLVASLMLPIFLPEWLLPDKLTRAIVALTAFAAAYLAEVIRGGLQAVPRGQFDAATALGLGYWRTQALVVLPQAIRIVIPALANTIIVMVKNTSLVLVVGLFDLISSGKAALADPDWPSPTAETYVFIGALYFVLAFSFARFADFLESRRPASH